MKKPLLYICILFCIFISCSLSIFAQPGNDNCPGTTLVPGSTNTSGTVRNATASAGIPVGCATGNPNDDVWYNFVAVYTYATVTLSDVVSSLQSSGAMIQLFSRTGACTGYASIACGQNVLNATGLTIGNTYYIRVYSAGASNITTAGTQFNISVTPSAVTTVGSGRMKEVYQQTILSTPQILADPWEITYGPDDKLWITEAKGYKVYRMDPNTGERTTVLDISQGASGYLTAGEHTTFNVQFASNFSPWPQGGMAGLALHPKFLDATTPKNYVYISYVQKYVSTAPGNGGVFFTNQLVRFTYNTGTGKLESPVSLCDTLPGSSDHNSQRIIIAPVGGIDYLFYAQGDMGAGQFGNQYRENKAQNPDSYEGKILRFNLEPDGDVGTLNKWIPNDNPLNGATQSAVWATGIRNNQGFAYNPQTGLLYGTSHGPYSDDELNIIERNKNYGHPIVIGYAADGNYNNSTAGSPNTTSACPLITNEVSAAAAISNYKDPLYSTYAPNQATLHNIWLTNPPNGGWPSEAWSGLDIYTNTQVPGWKNSLIAASLKWGRLVRLKLGTGGATIIPISGTDTVSYFGGTNRFRDLALAPNGKDMYVIMDRSATTSGPSQANPVVPACGGCVQKYTFLGYADAAGKSSIPTAIDVTDGTVNTCNTGTTVTIDATNNNLWVPITGPDGNIMAEINTAGQNLGTITSSFYQNSGAIRTRNGVHYLDRNITITPQTQPGSPVKIRLYLSKAEFDALDLDPLGGVSAITDLKILKNGDPCSSGVATNTTLINPTFEEAHGSNGYMLQASISSFSSFYFGASNITLPVELISFTGALQNSTTALLKWKTEHEVNTVSFTVERSVDGVNFSAIGSVNAAGTSNSIRDYLFTDNTVADQQVQIVYYRLKIIDVDGSFKYSNIITINLADITGNISIYPNPVSKEVSVTILSATTGKVELKITNNTGSVLYRGSYQVRAGQNSITVNTDKLSAGVYYVSVSGAVESQPIKMLKTN